MSETKAQLVIWALCDGRIGIDNQVVGLAEAVANMIPAKIERKLAPRRSLLSLFSPTKPTAHMNPPWPDIVIGCGRIAMPYTIGMRKWSTGKSFVIQLQNPRKKPGLFDLVVAPRHDQLEGDNVLSITGATNRISPEKLAAAKLHFAEQIEALPAPRMAVIIGGNSKHHKLTKSVFKDMCAQLKKLSKANVSLMITTSRRTPGFARRHLRRSCGRVKNAWLWSNPDKDGENPYLAFLASADAVLVTSDSTNMLTDAASAGKPVLMYRLDGSDGKFSDLYEDLEKRNHIHPFTGALSTWDVEPLAETRRAAEEALRRFYQHLQKPADAK